MHLTLGKTGITTSALALGCARIGSALTPLSRRECVALIEEAFDLGIRHFDTASIYGQGDSERFLGEALNGRRSQVCISTKAGQRLTPKQALLAHFKGPIRLLAARRGIVRSRVAEQRSKGVPRCFEPDYIERSLDQSLKRLQVDHVDIFYLHSPHVVDLRNDALLERIARMREKGKFRAFGVSCDELAVAWAAADVESVEVVQFAFDNKVSSRELLNLLAERGKQAVLRGFASGAADAGRHEEVLTQRLRHSLGLPALGGLIVGTTNPVHLRENVAAWRKAIA
jgi:aryl-alcohol dehydrogenase-like predicted oxidoreductase